MKRTISRITLVVAASLLMPLAAQAQLFRAYLASYGNDANPCTVGAPCRLLPAAISAVSSGGEIWMLDSANFNSGTVDIGKNVIIQAIPGQVGSIVPVATSPAITIQPNTTVTLRNVAIVTNANNPGTDGIVMTTGSLAVEDSVFEVWGSNFATPNGVAIKITGAGFLSVRNTTFRHGYRGIWASGGARVDVTTSKFVDFAVTLGAGVYAEATPSGTVTRVAVAHSEFARLYAGFWLEGVTSGGIVTGSLLGSSVTHANYGVVSENVGGGTTNLAVSGSQLTLSSYGMFQYGTGSVLESLGNNLVRNNPSNTSGTITIVGGN